jgi:xylan 1,4-beta-xylosidase
MKTSYLALSTLALFAVGAAAMLSLGQAATPAPIPVTMSVDFSKPAGALKPIWRWNGYDEPNYTYMPNGKKLVKDFSDAGKAQGPAYFRAHYLLCTGDGTPRPKWGSTNAYTEDANGNPIYDWTIVDKIFDTYVQAGAKPFVQIGMMPKALSTNPEPYEPAWTVENAGNLYTGWAYPPKDYNKWRELVYQWAKHCLERYGQAEVESWYWEVWNEANIGYWKGTPEEFRKLYDYAADGLRKAIPKAKIGGAETAGPGGTFQTDFIKHALEETNYATGQKGSPLDLFAFHAKGSPAMAGPQGGQRWVRMGISSQLRNINDGFRIAASRPETKALPIVIGESDPDSCAGCAASEPRYQQYGYRNTSLFAVYTINQLARTLDLAERHGVNILGSVNWAFEFEEQPIFRGFRVLSTDGINLPVLNVYRMLGKMGPQRLTVTSSGDLGLDAVMGSGVRGDRPDVHALASRGDRKVTVVMWNYHDDDVPGPTAAISLAVSGLPAEASRAKLTEWRIDVDHSNAHTVWKSLGSPAKLDADQRKKLEAASELAVVRGPVDVPAVQNGTTTITVNLPRQGVGLVEITW